MILTFNNPSSFSSNTYLVKESTSILIDAGYVSFRLINELKESPLKAILLTHGHFDHILNLQKIINLFPEVPIFSFEDKQYIINPHLNGSYDLLNQPITLNIKKINPLKEGIMNIDSFKVDVYNFKGHTNGGGAFYFPYEKVLFLGDTIFKDGIGRYDLVGGSYHQLIESLNRIKTLNISDDTICYFGHGEKTTFKDLKLNNPYLR